MRQHIQALAQAIGMLQPKLVYLARQDVGATLEAVRRERPQAWADFVIWYLTGQEYGKAHGLSGFEGVIAFYAVRQAFALGLLRTLPISHVVISEDLDWNARYENLTSFLEEKV